MEFLGWLEYWVSSHPHIVNHDGEKNGPQHSPMRSNPVNPNKPCSFPIYWWSVLIGWQNADVSEWVESSNENGVIIFLTLLDWDLSTTAASNGM